MTPQFSIVVPTRDRPDLAEVAVRSVLSQECGDFEIIVVDNGISSTCEEVQRLSDRRLHYVRPPRPLSMHDNWEFGAELSSGEYVSILIDKTVWLPSTLAVTSRSVAEHPAQVVSWWTDDFVPSSGTDLSRGVRIPYPGTYRAPRLFDGRKALLERMSMTPRRGQEGPRYFAGKICFGAYRRDLIEEIRNRCGRLFPPISPDYTSMCAALRLGTSFLDIGRPLQLQICAPISNGTRVLRDPAYAKRFLLEVGPAGEIIDRLPIPGLYSSSHNIVAHDYLAAEPEYQLDRHALAQRAREDLKGVAWTDTRVRDEQWAILRGFEDQLSRDQSAPGVRQQGKSASIGSGSRSIWWAAPDIRRTIRSLAGLLPPTARTALGVLLGHGHSERVDIWGAIETSDRHVRASLIDSASPRG